MPCSMGGMISMKLAVMAPERVASLSVISATGGGWQSLPFSWRATRYMWKVGHRLALPLQVRLPPSCVFFQ